MLPLATQPLSKLESNTLSKHTGIIIINNQTNKQIQQTNRQTKQIQQRQASIVTHAKTHYPPSQALAQASSTNKQTKENKQTNKTKQNKQTNRQTKQMQQTNYATTHTQFLIHCPSTDRGLVNILFWTQNLYAVSNTSTDLGFAIM